MDFQNNEERLKFLNEKCDEIKERQLEELEFDFDEALNEYSKEKSFKVKFANKIFTLPMSMPFNFSTFFLRYCYKKIDGKMIFTVPDEHFYKFLELMFGREFLTSLERSRASINFVFETIVPKVMSKWGYDIDSSKNKDIQKKMKMLGL